MSKIYFIMGVSGSGKGTLIKNLQKLNKDEKIFFPLSYKSRPKRESELDGIDAKFISKDKFEKMIESGEFLEYAKVHDMHYYGTSLKDIQSGIDSNKLVIKELDINGLELMKERLYLGFEYQTIFLSIDEETLKQRIEKRGDYMSQEELEKRLNSARNETQKAHKYCDHIIDATQNEEEILKNVVNIIIKEIKKQKDEEIIRGGKDNSRNDDGYDAGDFISDSIDFIGGTGEVVVKILFSFLD